MADIVLRNLSCNFAGSAALSGPVSIAFQQSVSVPFDSNIVGIHLSSALSGTYTGLWVIAERTDPILRVSGSTKILASQSLGLLIPEPQTSGSVFNKFVCRPYFLPALTPVSLYAGGSPFLNNCFGTVSIHFRRVGP